MESLEAELARARDLSVSDLADAIESIGFECTRCGACCTAETGCAGGEENNGDATGDEDDERSADPHTATVFPDEIRTIQEGSDYDFRDVARPMPYGLSEGPDGPEGETFEWALQTDDCGDCTFYEERPASETPHGDGDADGADGHRGTCTIHEDRPLVCRTYPFSVALGGTSQPMGEAVDAEGMVRAHECEGLGRDISRAEAEDLARALAARAVRELEEAIAVRKRYESVDTDGVIVHDSEGQKRPDGTPFEGG